MQLTSPYIDPDLYMYEVTSINENSFDGETWQDIYGIAASYYQTSSLGRIRAKQDIIYNGRNCMRHRFGDVIYYDGEIVKQDFKGEYTTVHLYVPGCTTKTNPYSSYSHIIIYKSYNNGEDTDSVDHINGNKHDNRICNLQNLSVYENSQKSYLNDESHRWSNRKSSVICVETNKLYKHVNEAAEDMKTDDSAIISAITSGTICRSYHWKYADKEKQAKIDDKRAEVHQRRKSTPPVSGNWIYCYEDNYISQCSDIARKSNCETEVIYNAIDYNDGYSKFLNKHFKIVDPNTINFLSPDMQKYIKESYFYRNRIVHNLEDDLYFISMKSASQYYGISVDAIKDSIIRNKKVCKKYTFEKNYHRSL